MKKMILTAVLSLSCIATGLTALETYKIQDLGTLSYQVSDANEINNNGEICGQYGYNDKFYVYYWSPSLGLVPTEIQTQFFPHINNKGQIAGTIDVNGWTFKSYHPFVWDIKSGMKDLGVPGTSNWGQAISRSINDEGEVLLQNLSSGKINALYAAVWKNGTFKELSHSTILLPRNITNKSDVLGLYLDNNTAAPTIYSTNTGSSKKVILKDWAIPTDMNENNQIVGEYYVRSEDKWCGFLWDSKNGIVIFKDFIPTAINNLGHIVGHNSNKVPLLYKNGALFDINEMLKLSKDQNNPWQSVYFVKDINDKGQIVGYGSIGGSVHACLITPILQ